MPTFIPVLFTSANPLTEAHLLVLQKAMDILKQLPGAEVPKSVISPAHDNYVQGKSYSKLRFDGDKKKYERPRLDAVQRIGMAYETVSDFNQSFFYGKQINFEVDEYETKHTSVEFSNNKKRRYIEHYERLRHLQEFEIANARAAGREPALYVLVGGADLANAMKNWVHPDYNAQGMPFLVAMRVDEKKNPEGKLESDQNLTGLKEYCESFDDYSFSSELFADFQSQAFICDSEEDVLFSLSSTKLANCDVTAINAMGKNAFRTWWFTLLIRSTDKNISLPQQQAAKRILSYLQSNKESFDYAKQELMSEDKIGIELNDEDEIDLAFKEIKEIKEIKEKNIKEKPVIKIEVKKEAEKEIEIEELEKNESPPKKQSAAQRPKGNRAPLRLVRSLRGLLNEYDDKWFKSKARKKEQLGKLRLTINGLERNRNKKTSNAEFYLQLLNEITNARREAIDADIKKNARRFFKLNRGGESRYLETLAKLEQKVKDTWSYDESIVLSDHIDSVYTPSLEGEYTLLKERLSQVLQSEPESFKASSARFFRRKKVQGKFDELHALLENKDTSAEDLIGALQRAKYLPGNIRVIANEVLSKAQVLAKL